MNIELTQQSYGKSNVRLSHVSRANGRHEFRQLSVSVLLDGDFEKAYTDGDNANVVPTDTMKNTVYALAKVNGIESIESFAEILANHFVDNFEHVEHAEVEIEEQLWHRIDLDGEQHGHAFVGGGSEENTCHVIVTDEGIVMSSGIQGLQVLKTTESGFEGFNKDEYTSLKATNDRIFATTITADWSCGDLDHDWTTTRRAVRQLLLDIFAHNYSPSVQKTLFEMGESVLAACPEVAEISLNMPNQHHLLADIAKIGLDNENEIFVPTEEPFGVISATVCRKNRETLGVKKLPSVHATRHQKCGRRRSGRVDPFGCRS